MTYHFREEEDYIRPPLGLLPLLTSGEITEQNKAVLQLTEKLKSKFAVMSAGHQMIHVHLNELKDSCSNDMLPEVVEFEKELEEHAAREEEILFPAAILVGAYIKLKMAE